MRKVKLVWAKSNDIYDERETEVIVDGLSGWEEIEDEDLSILERNLYHLNNGSYSARIFYFNDDPVAKTITSIKEFLAKQKKKKEKEEEERRVKKEKASLKKQKTIEQQILDLQAKLK